MGRNREFSGFSPTKDGDFDVDGDPSLVLTLARGLSVLNCFNASRQQLSNKEIAAITGLSKPTVSRLTYTLAKFGYLRYVPSGQRYCLGLSVLATAHPLLAQMRLRQVSRPLMQSMANEIGGVVSIGMQYGRAMIYVESCASGVSVNPVVAGIGSQIPMFRTAMGRAYLCGLEVQARAHLFDSVLRQDQRSHAYYLDNLNEALEQYDKWGFCLASKSLVRDARSVGVPLGLSVDDQQYAFNCGVPVHRLNDHRLVQEIGPRLLQLVRDVKVSVGVG